MFYLIESGKRAMYVIDVVWLLQREDSDLALAGREASVLLRTPDVRPVGGNQTGHADVSSSTSYFS
jgi:hypothetical protein